MKKFNEVQENSERQSNKLKNKINEQEYFTKEIKTIKKNQTNSGDEENKWNEERIRKHWK